MPTLRTKFETVRSTQNKKNDMDRPAHNLMGRNNSKFRKIITFISTALALVVLSGCVSAIEVRLSITESLTFYDAKTGHITIDVGMDQTLFQALETQNTSNPEQSLQSNPYLKNIKLSNTFDGELNHIVANADITDMAGFLQADGTTGSLTKLSNGNYLYQYTLASSVASGLSNMMIKDSNPNDFLTLQVKVPVVVNCNGVLDKSTGFYKWKVPMSQILDKSANLDVHMEFQPGLPWLEILLIVCPLIMLGVIMIGVVVGVAGYFIYKSRKNADPVTTS
jgi:hypothetical protein